MSYFLVVTFSAPRPKFLCYTPSMLDSDSITITHDGHDYEYPAHLLRGLARIAFEKLPQIQANHPEDHWSEWSGCLIIVTAEEITYEYGDARDLEAKGTMPNCIKVTSVPRGVDTLAFMARQPPYN